MINKRILGLIGLSAKARNICFGADSVEMNIKSKKVFLVLIAEDASNRTQEKFKKICETYKIPVIIEGTIEELSKSIGKNNKAIIGIENKNLSEEIEKISNGGDVIG